MATRLPATTPAEVLGDNVRRARTHLGYALSDLAARMGVARSDVAAIEAGEYLPSAARAIELAVALECRVDDLLVGIDPRYDVRRGVTSRRRVLADDVEAIDMEARVDNLEIGWRLAAQALAERLDRLEARVRATEGK
jgi:transcriptional regulator with XRE-family HTH domain